MSKTAVLALEAHLDALFHIFGCVVHQRPQWQFPGARLRSGSAVYVMFPNGAPIRLSTGSARHPLWMLVQETVVLHQHFDHSWHTTLDNYTYQLFRGDGQSRFDEIVTYHWTPNDPGARRAWPHLHIGSTFIDPGARREPWSLHKTHFATGPMPPNAFVRMAVEEFGVQPVVADWQARITEPVGHP